MKMNDDYLTGAERELVEELMDLCLKRMDDRVVGGCASAVLAPYSCGRGGDSAA